MYQRVLSQKRDDRDKVYTIHEPDVKCYVKEKKHKKLEFGSKASILVDQSTGIIMGAINFTETLHDSKTLPEALEQYERLTGQQPVQVFVVRGYKYLQKYKNLQINVSKPDKKTSRAKRKRHSKKTAIELVIGHLKADYRLCRNFLKGILGDMMNVILAADAINFKRVINLCRTETNDGLTLIDILYMFVLNTLLPEKLNMTF
ncbi:transposase [Arcticibacter eurypsychrophilus]|uniref:transposase n=1 Tax=Arcticibacter eurypsychrophilus TaxID=1434752 RepID=UPI0009F36E90|nr:transposase [Arcticibacter eurypsychrophilus]